MNGISRRSNRSCGNWMSSALPIVSALIPVLLDKKNTGVAAGACEVTDALPERLGQREAGRPERHHQCRLVVAYVLGQAAQGQGATQPSETVDQGNPDSADPVGDVLVRDAEPALACDLDVPAK